MVEAPSLIVHRDGLHTVARSSVALGRSLARSWRRCELWLWWNCRDDRLHGRETVQAIELYRPPRQSPHGIADVGAPVGKSV
jgi:hypothetical protein